MNLLLFGSSPMVVLREDGDAVWVSSCYWLSLRDLPYPNVH